MFSPNRLLVPNYLCTMSRYAACVLILLAFCACNRSGDTSTAQSRKNRPPSPYFDMGAFLDTLERNSLTLPLRKSTSSSDGLETAVIKSPLYHRELAIFRAADLTRPAWRGLFTIDSVTGKQHSFFTYKTTAGKPELRMLRVLKNTQNRPVRIAIDMAQTNYLFNSTSQAQLWVRYDKGLPQLDSLSVVGTQHMLMGREFNYLLNGKTL
jgi:hypothetical protein